MITFKSPEYNASKLFTSCDLLSKSPGIPNVTVWALGQVEPCDCEGWIDIFVNRRYLHRCNVIDALANHFKVPVSGISIV